ncbi:MAG: class A beta-lactamase [Acidobacteriota bacterium]
MKTQADLAAMSLRGKLPLLVLAAFVPLLIPAHASQPAAQADSQHLTRVQREIDRLEALSGGKAGVAAIHLESGRTVYFGADDPYPMASTYKVPIAVQLLHRVDQGQIRLGQMITLKPGDLHPGSGTISRLLNDPGVSLSLANLLELMLIISDNSATDLVLKAAGGPQAVTNRLRELEVDGIRVDRPTLNLIADWAGIKLPDGEWNPDGFADLYREVPELRREAASITFNGDPRDTSTPRGMTRLLEKIWRGQALSPDSTRLLLDIMRRCETGENRLKGLLPPFVEVAHKTGTIGGTSNDVGIITLPDGAGHVAVSIFIKESERDVAQREKAIAHISRAVYDFFLLQPDAED